MLFSLYISLQYYCLENPMDGGAWQATVSGVTELDMTEQLTHTHNHPSKSSLGSLSRQHSHVTSCMSLIHSTCCEHFPLNAKFTCMPQKTEPLLNQLCSPNNWRPSLYLCPRKKEEEIAMPR